LENDHSENQEKDGIITFNFSRQVVRRKVDVDGTGSESCPIA
jgi:hypothetical protein